MQTSNRFGRTDVPLAALIVVSCIGYMLPWAAATSSALTFSAYDLAEWTSLIPSVRYGPAPMAVPGQLRSVLIAVTLLVALAPSRRRSWAGVLALAAGFGLIAAQLPPLEYFIGVGFAEDVNYGQQFTFTVLSLIGGVLCWLVPRGAARTAALALTGALGAVVAIVAAAYGIEVLSGLKVGFSPGIGSWVTAGGMVGVAVAAVLRARSGESQGAPLAPL